MKWQVDQKKNYNVERSTIPEYVLIITITWVKRNNSDKYTFNCPMVEQFFSVAFLYPILKENCISASQYFSARIDWMLRQKQPFLSSSKTCSLTFILLTDSDRSKTKC